MTLETAGMTISLSLALAVAAAAQQPPDAARTGREPARSDPARSVTLSLTEYNRLIDLASRPPQTTPVAPVPALLSNADLRIRVDRDTARGVFNLAGDVLRSGINRVNLVSGATILEGSMDGRPLPLVIDGGTHAALLPGPGPFAVALEWGAPLTFAPGRASFVLPVPPAGAAHATIDVPGEKADLHLSAGLITRRTAANGRTVVDVTLRPGTQAEVWWSMRDSAPVAAAREVRMLADVLSLLTIGESDLRMVALVDLTVVQGEPRTIEVRLPAGYELAGLSGQTIESSEPRERGVVLTVVDASVRRHQFLVSLERVHAGGSFAMDTEFVALPGVQRERGEIAIEGVGTLELDAAERSGMHRIDVREINPALQSLARLPLLSAFRYQRNAATQVALAMTARRFPDAGVLAAVADHATATTLITSEGRALTEVVLQVRNRAQPFLKVSLPAGATLVSVEVAGESAKPVVGPDGTRVPLLRPGFRPTGLYPVSFVYLHAGAPFGKKGELEMALPQMDMPVGLVDWELFVPNRYRVQTVGGNVIPKTVADVAAVRPGAGFGPGSAVGRGVGGGVVGGVGGGVLGGVGGGTVRSGDARVSMSVAHAGLPGQVRGQVRDASGNVLPGTAIVLESGSVRKAAVTAGDGTFVISGVPSGNVTVTARIEGFNPRTCTFLFDQQAPQQIDFTLDMPGLAETVTVTGASPAVPQSADAHKSEPSQNVLNLQKRAAGVLPIRVDVPRAGTSHQYVKPLVVDQAATVSLRYKRR